MTTLRLSSFLGENRAAHPMLLPDGVGVLSRNQKPGRGDLRPWKNPLQVATVPAGRNTIYRMGRDVASDANYWLSWATVVYAVRGFDQTDPTERTYYTGDGTPKVTDNIMALAAPPYPTTSRPLGVPAPTGTPIATPAGGGTGQIETIFYVYTFVTDWGWESAPSPVSNQVDAPGDESVTVTGFSSAPAGNYNINRLRLYRTQADSGGSADFFFVAEVPYGTASIVDDKTVLEEVLPTSGWLPAPDDLSNLTALWNGMLAGISAKAVRFCQAYTPYAWPDAYDVVPPDSTPVGLGVFGQQLVVLTTGRPLLVSGSGPDAMDQALIEMPQGCVATRSIVSMGYGVAWASNDGLCFFGTDGPKILTAGLMMREDWLKLKPETIIGKMYEGLYFGSYDDGTGGGRKGFFINPGQPTGIFFLDKGYPALHFDELMDQLYVLDVTAVKKWDAALDSMTTVFRSKVTHLPQPVKAFAAAEVVADTYPVTVRFYADGALKFTKVVPAAGAFRLPSGFYAQNWQAEVETVNPVQLVAMAHSVTELKQV